MGIEEYKYLWTTEKDKHILVKFSEDRYGIFDKSINSALIIEDDEIYQLVVEEMLKNGNQVIGKDDLKELTNRK